MLRVKRCLNIPQKHSLLFLVRLLENILVPLNTPLSEIVPGIPVFPTESFGSPQRANIRYSAIFCKSYSI